MSSTAGDSARYRSRQSQAPARDAADPALPIGGELAERHDAGQFWRSVRELAAIPLVVVVAFAVLAAVSIVADQTKAVGALNSLRDVLGHVVGKEAATNALSGIATGLVTVTSITFSVLLLAVQQTASSLSPVVYDQFLRRRTNQAFLGFFIGLALFAYVVMAAVQDRTPPIVGASVATVLTLVALMILLVLVYSTINQMRPTSVLRMLHDRALAAREREAELIRRTRRQSTSHDDVAAQYVSHATGYLSSINLRRLEKLLEGLEGVEIELAATVGDHVSYGDLLAVVRDGDRDRAQRIARQLGRLLELSQARSLGSDATTGVDEIGNIAWTSTSTAKHNPEVGREGLFSLRDLAARWILDDPVDDQALGGHELPVVYRDNDLDRTLSWIHSLLIASHESQQHLLAAAVLDTYRALLHLAPDDVSERLRDDVTSALGVVAEMPVSPTLRGAWRDVLDAVDVTPREAEQAPSTLKDLAR